MQSIADIARRDGVSKPTVSIAVKRLVEQHNLTVERDGQGRVALVNVAEYDHLRGRYGDPSKAQAPSKPQAPGRGTPSIEGGDSYDEALRQKTWHEAEKRRIELDELKGRLVPTAGVRAAGLEAVAKMTGAFDLAVQDIADALAGATGADARVIRPHLRRLRERALEEFRRSLQTALSLDPEEPAA